MKASRFFRDKMVQKDRQHQLRSEALVWKGKKDYMNGPIVETTVEEAVKKAEKWCSKRTLKMMEKADQQARAIKAKVSQEHDDSSQGSKTSKVMQQADVDMKKQEQLRKQEMHDEFMRSILEFCQKEEKEAVGDR